MSLFLKSQITKINFLSILIALFPISFIAGNMIININLILLILSALLLFQKKIFQVQYHYIDKLLILFFLLVLSAVQLNLKESSIGEKILFFLCPYTTIGRKKLQKN